ncbi:hypothetical protein [Pseudonocardia sp. DSM 110487]|uniref:hypothetical protein n=1 Tax=Pseudonocardia sp. DSM 110487 TaxID=2865833 RepID=UPI0021025660|nr:hypothetical protein [Pseudonocardia sp. DSM 110487]
MTRTPSTATPTTTSSHQFRPGLGTLTAAQRALADFLRLDDDLLAIAAQTSPPLKAGADDPGELAARVTRLPVAEKDRLLARVAQGEAARVRTELLRSFRGATDPTIPAPPDRYRTARRRRAAAGSTVSIGWLHDVIDAPQAPVRPRIQAGGRDQPEPQPPSPCGS